MKTTRLFLFFTFILPFIFSSVSAQTSADVNTYNSYVKKGSDQLHAADYAGARDSFNEALRSYDKGSAAHLGLGLAYFNLRDDATAERELSQAVTLDEKSSTAYQFLGEIYYRKDDLASAVQYWEKAVALDPSADALRVRLERVRKEHRTEKDFNQDVASHFTVKYEGREKIEAGRIILRVLEDAYGEVGRGLATYPDRDIQVILYSTQQFSEVTDAPGWSGGVYDGKIRIPIGGIEKETPGLRKLLFHEYTHAVVRNISRRCPTWLNEGLAQYFEGREIEYSQRDALRQIAKAGKLPSLSGLEGSFTGLNGNQAMFAYVFSLSAVRYLVDNFGMYRARNILEELAAGADMGRAIDRALSISYEDFDRGWKRSLE